MIWRAFGGVRYVAEVSLSSWHSFKSSQHLLHNLISHRTVVFDVRNIRRHGHTKNPKVKRVSLGGRHTKRAFRRGQIRVTRELGHVDASVPPEIKSVSVEPDEESEVVDSEGP
jgi:hypothetical protein